MKSNEEIKRGIEALLFVSFNPVTIDTLKEVLEMDEETIKIVLEEILNEYSAKGIHVIKVADGYQMVSAPEAASLVEKIYKKISRQFLSRAALETLAIIAFKQPVTRSQVENLRGVNVDKIINNLLEKRLIREAGKSPILGKPTLYGTTNEFLRYFNLSSIEELPEFKNFSEFLNDSLEEEKRGEVNA